MPYRGTPRRPRALKFVNKLVQITSQIALTRSLFKFENHTLVHRYFMSVFYLGDKDGLDVQQLIKMCILLTLRLGSEQATALRPGTGKSFAEGAWDKVASTARRQIDGIVLIWSTPLICLVTWDP